MKLEENINHAWLPGAPLEQGKDSVSGVASPSRMDLPGCTPVPAPAGEAWGPRTVLGAPEGTSVPRGELSTGSLFADQESGAQKEPRTLQADRLQGQVGLQTCQGRVCPQTPMPGGECPFPV